MARSAALTLALLSTGAAWALVAATEFDVLVAVGILALAAGLWVLAQPLPRWIRFAAVIAALTALPATAGWRMKQLAGGVRPFSSGCPGFRDLTDVTLPLASEGELPRRGDERVVISLDRYGVLTWKGKNASLAEVDQILDAAGAAGRPLVPVVVRADKDVPIRLLGWLMLVARAHGRTEVRVAAVRSADGFFSNWERDALAAESRSEYWPELDLVFPMAADDNGVRLRILGTEVGAQRWGAGGPQGRASVVRTPTRARYQLGGRTTDDLRELARWMRDTPPRWIEADPAVQVKFVVAAQNQIRKAGHPPAALILPDPPSEAIRNAPSLPYPGGD